MCNLSVFNSNQKKILRFLYENRGIYTLEQISSHCGSIPFHDIDALTKPEYGPAVLCISTPHRGKTYQITSEGCGIWETLQKQATDEVEERNNKAKELDIAQEANNIAQEANKIAKDGKKQAVLANWLSFFALLISIISALIDIFQAVRP